VHLESGESKKVHFELQPRDLGMVSAEGVPMIAEGEYTVSVGGGQPRTGAKVVSRTFKIKGKMTLPE
jgi:beta-glucosidase